MPCSPRGYKTLPSCSIPIAVGSGLAPGRQPWAAHRHAGVRGMRSRDEQHQPCRKGGLLQRRPCPCKQQHSGNKQLRITCSPRLTSHAACQPPQQWWVLICAWETLQPKTPPSPSFPSRAFFCCFSAHLWLMSLFDTHWRTEKGNLLSEQKNRREKESGLERTVPWPSPCGHAVSNSWAALGSSSTPSPASAARAKGSFRPTWTRLVGATGCAQKISRSCQHSYFLQLKNSVLEYGHSPDRLIYIKAREPNKPQQIERCTNV